MTSLCDLLILYLSFHLEPLDYPLWFHFSEIYVYWIFCVPLVWRFILTSCSPFNIPFVHRFNLVLVFGVINANQNLEEDGHLFLLELFWSQLLWVLYWHYNRFPVFCFFIAVVWVAESRYLFYNILVFYLLAVVQPPLIWRYACVII